jgi:hypothetical protein
MLTNQMQNATQAIEQLKVVMENPWMLTFLAIFLLGWLLKEHTKLSNKLIPWVLTVTGAILGLFLIEYSVAGGIMGCALAYIEMALYEKIKNTVEYFVERNETYIK